MRAQEEVEAAVAHLKQELKRPPTEAEIAGEVGIEVAEYQDFLNQYSRAHFVSLEANDRTGVEYRELIKDPAALGPQSQVDAGDLRAQRIAAIDELDERERLVATFYFYEGLTLKEIGRAFNLTEGRVSQILHRALTKLHEHLKGSPLAHGYWQHNAG